MAALRIINPREPEIVVDVPEELTIGRHRGRCDLVLPSRSVSRIHARIVLENEQYFLEDLGSRNQTMLDGVPLTTGTDGRRPLKDGSLLKLADVVLRFEESAPEKRADPSSWDESSNRVAGGISERNA